MAETVPSINLLPQKGESFLTQFFNWTLSIGRLLIILTEMVALGTFLYRFTLDMQIVDLHDKIKGQSLIVSSFKSSEDTYRNLQDRLLLIKNYDSIGSNTSSIFSDITQFGQGKVTFLNLTVDSENAKIEAQAPSSASISQFVEQLKNYPSITSVSVDKVENSTSRALISVSITATLKPAPFAKPETDTPAQTTAPSVDAN
jgi:hypothetical protein